MPAKSCATGSRETLGDEDQARSPVVVGPVAVGPVAEFDRRVGDAATGCRHSATEMLASHEVRFAGALWASKQPRGRARLDQSLHFERSPSGAALEASSLF
jgi:hypothetical protein